MDMIQKIRDILACTLAGKGTAFLYGSRARGTAHAASDWDVLIILDKDKIVDSDYDEITYPLLQAGWDMDQIINPVIYTGQEWIKQSFTPFYKNVERDKIRLL